MQLITASRKATFQQCSRLHHYQYEQGFRALGTIEALEFGLGVHGALDGWWGAYKRGEGFSALSHAQAALDECASRLDEVALAKARVLVQGYDARWAAEMADLKVIAVELEFLAPLLDAEGKPIEGEYIAGKIDKLVQRISTGGYWNVEHKTSGSDLSPGSIYWQKLKMDGQISLYYDGAKAHGYDIDGCIYDVIAKPEKRPLKATPEENRKYTKNGALYANQRAFDEPIDEFRQRLMVEVSENPADYFHRVEVIRLESELEEARRDVRETAQLMKLSRDSGLSPRSPNACFSYGRPCSFIPVCTGAGSLDDDTQFRKLAFPHAELTQPKGP